MEWSKSASDRGAGEYSISISFFRTSADPKAFAAPGRAELLRDKACNGVGRAASLYWREDPHLPWGE